MAANKIRPGREIGIALFVRMPIIAAAVATVIVASILVIIVIATLWVNNNNKDLHEKAHRAAASPDGQAQTIIGLANCFTGNPCPADNPTATAGKVVAATSTINGQTFMTPSTDADWASWGKAISRYGTLSPESVTSLSQGAMRTLQVATDAGQTLICTTVWNERNQLTSWTCNGATS